MRIEKPYVLFLGDAPDTLSAKVARGIAHWRGEDCVGQLKLEPCHADVGLPSITLAQAVERGARTLVIGVANRGGVISEAWRSLLNEALCSGLDIASGLHDRLADVPSLAQTAANQGRRLIEVRHPSAQWLAQLRVADGRARAGKRLLAVGTDCSVGKMYTTLALEQELHKRQVPADFRATGQAGILIAGEGISVDAVVADFISGAVELLSPPADPAHWDIIEGQGSLFHPSFAGVTLGLIHGAQPDALVLCHEPTRAHMRGVPEYPLPDLRTCMEANLTAARLTNPDARFVGVSVNTSAMSAGAAEQYLVETAAQLQLPVVDPVRGDTAPIADNLL